MPRTRNSARPLFQRRHFEYIASQMRHARDRATVTGEHLAVEEIDRLVRTFGRSFVATNPHFDASRFTRACGVDLE